MQNIQFGAMMPLAAAALLAKPAGSEKLADIAEAATTTAVSVSFLLLAAIVLLSALEQAHCQPKFSIQLMIKAALLPVPIPAGSTKAAQLTAPLAGTNLKLSARLMARR